MTVQNIGGAAAVAAPIESILLSTVRISTFAAAKQMTGASGFFYECDDGLFLITNRHVVIDEPSSHHPDRIEIEVHVQADNIAASAAFSIPLYFQGTAVWREGQDGGGVVDIVAIRIEREALPAGIVYQAFTPAHLSANYERIEVGAPLLIVGFPLGFHDLLHHLPVVRHAVIASSFGMRFQGQGFFLTDARTHRGTSGAPVVMRMSATAGSQYALPWMLLGVHSSRFDVGSRDVGQDDYLGLNSAWYADMLTTLTGPRPEPVTEPLAEPADALKAGLQAGSLGAPQGEPQPGPEVIPPGTAGAPGGMPAKPRRRKG